jgi:hypothetical protein
MANYVADTPVSGRVAQGDAPEHEVGVALPVLRDDEAARNA